MTDSTKAQILELYLNRIYLSAGVYGVEPMARRVFGKPAAALAGASNSPRFSFAQKAA